MLHLRNDRFPTQRKSKLLPCGDGPFQIIKIINDNAYELDLPNTYSGRNYFNVNDLTPFSAGFANSWTNSLPPEEHDEDLRDRAFFLFKNTIVSFQFTLFTFSIVYNLCTFTFLSFIFSLDTKIFTSKTISR